MLSHVLALSDLIMVIGLAYCLRCCRHCRLFWVVQALQLTECVDFIRHAYAVQIHWKWAMVNWVLDGLVLPFMWRHFRAAFYLMATSFVLMWFRLQYVDTIYDFARDSLSWTLFGLDLMLLALLLGYSVREGTLPFWRMYVNAQT